MALFHRAEKISIGYFSMELAKVDAIAPQWTPTDSTMDIRKSMSSAEVTDSTAGHFTTQLTYTTPADLAIEEICCITYKSDGIKTIDSRILYR